VAGEAGFVQRFCDLGFFRYIFLQSNTVIINHVVDKLGPIINYDNGKDGQLMATLRILIDNGFNWKETAAKCNVHVNTIYYRVERIEKLLSIKLNNTESKFTLYVALKSWDILTELGEIDNYYIGSIGKIAR
jgi:DNA-binding PucR family transcriptional regulator